MKVGKNNFRPPPKVESSIVRIKPHSPPPPINFVVCHILPSYNIKEWDGLVRICFSRKAKTLASIFKQRGVLELLEQNYQTFCSLTNQVRLLLIRDTQPVEENFNVKETITRILDETGFSESRSSKLDQDAFLKYASFFPFFTHLDC